MGLSLQHLRQYLVTAAGSTSSLISSCQGALTAVPEKRHLYVKGLELLLLTPSSDRKI